MTNDLMHHAPHCQRPSVTTEVGHSIDVHKCDGCGCLSTVRHDTTRVGQTDQQATNEQATNEQKATT
jgi:hypothetical protein